MRHLIRITLSLSFLLTPGGRALAEGDPALRLGAALHAFDHLGAQGQQLDAAVASGVTVIYATGVGSDGYEGIPATDVWKRHRDDAAAYCASAKARGVQRMIGYLCATSIVKLETFDAHWPDELRARLSKPPSEWRQQGRDGNPLPSWYGGDYQPACMNNPDWRTYEKYMVRMQLEAGHDGIFFDNPTVHPKGCYCPQCMDGFKDFMEGQGATLVDPTLQDLYKLADEHRQDFLRYRCTIARDFLAEMRAYARTIKPDALVTANNSLNSPQAFYSQCQDYAYNIAELSKAEDFIVLEDMGTQPRMTAKGDILEYGPTLRMVRAIANAKPIVNVTIAEADYHTPPNLMRLAMAESAANGASGRIIKNALVYPNAEIGYFMDKRQDIFPGVP